ncbi:Thiamine import ATP-binding protein ThiQ [Pseudovibrio axinellae]|uniref:Thiamine import ATP-binding protein ThiQ n=1 Tax=Pseudovibrio axinellae TaxID=989403 RepID=A0A165ZSK0_9HYPH|nr:ATP-binding cassette domain-containing protein [Pseudovibrio axinellae]KZL20231.1 Thiamine import ATP-binding protein ThiQ [Pseudovibrio axinellae]SEQ61934.1 thiamine transport system ATP-binding protein [Pseudovibrio axinellae]
MLKIRSCMITNGAFKLHADLDIEAASSVAVIGPSGAGKSTLLEAIAGFRDITDGRVSWNGHDLTNLAPGKRPIAMLFQDGNLFPHLTAEQNAALGLRPSGKLSRAEHLQVKAALERVGLAGMEARKPAHLSGGQQNRVALARVLLQHRDLLLLDEPFAALGPALKAEMLDLVAELVAETGTTLLMVSHDPQDARRITRKALLVADGTAHPLADTTQLLNNPPPALSAYLGTNQTH